MKKLYILFLFVTNYIISSAQIQLGIVKTLGRPNRPGVPLADVSIRMRGVFNAVLSGIDGKFSVLMPGKKDGDAIIIQRVSKNGYELVDPDIIERLQVFSSTIPIEIVMVNSEELAANKRRIERNAYLVAERNYQAKLKMLEVQIKEQQITEEQYQKQKQELQDKFEQYQSLIDRMADRYARTDYDHLDSVDREINICIENGELEKADSLIHSVFDPNTVLERNRAAKESVHSKKQLAEKILYEANEEKERLLRIQETIEKNKR